MRLAVLLVVTLTVSVILFPVREGDGGYMEWRDTDGGSRGLGIDMDVLMDSGDRSGWMDGGGRDRQTGKAELSDEQRRQKQMFRQKGAIDGGQRESGDRGSSWREETQMSG